jgi:hypothetical protein
MIGLKFCVFCMDDNFFLNLFDVSQLKGDRSPSADMGDHTIHASV